MSKSKNIELIPEMDVELHPLAPNQLSTSKLKIYWNLKQKQGLKAYNSFSESEIGFLNLDDMFSMENYLHFQDDIERNIEQYYDDRLLRHESS